MTQGTIQAKARIICGKNSDGSAGDQHRATDVARQLWAAGKWNGHDDIVIHDPHELHRKLQISGKPENSGYFNVYPGVHDLAEGEHYEIAAAAKPIKVLNTPPRSGSIHIIGATIDGERTRFDGYLDDANFERLVAACGGALPDGFFAWHLEQGENIDDSPRVQQIFDLPLAVTGPAWLIQAVDPVAAVMVAFDEQQRAAGGKIDVFSPEIVARVHQTGGTAHTPEEIIAVRDDLNAARAEWQAAYNALNACIREHSPGTLDFKMGPDAAPIFLDARAATLESKNREPRWPWRADSGRDHYPIKSWQREAKRGRAAARRLAKWLEKLQAFDEQQRDADMIAAGLDAEDLEGPTCESYECGERAAVEFTLMWCDQFEGEVTDTVYLCDECAAEYRAGTRARITGERRLDGCDDERIDDLACFGHFDGCVCKAEDACEAYTVVAHAAFLAPARHGANSCIAVTLHASGLIVAGASRAAFAKKQFEAALRRRFPDAPVEACADLHCWYAEVQVDNVREAVTVEECRLWLAIFGGPKDDDPKSQPPPDEPPADGDDTQPMPVFEHPLDEPYEEPPASAQCCDDSAGGIFNPQPFGIGYPPAPELPIIRDAGGAITGLRCLPTEAWRAQMRHALACGDASEATLLTEIQVEAARIAEPYVCLIQGNIAAFRTQRIAGTEVA